MDGVCRRPAGCAWVALFWLLLPPTALAQPPTAAGVVTQVQGQVDLIRQATTPVSLQFKDELFLRDTVNTGEESMARMLFGGRSSVTVRELTRFEVRSEVLPTGGSKTIYDLSDGKIRVIVVPKLMKPGDEIEIRTPNAVAGIRGTVVVAEHDRKTGISRYTVVDECCVIAVPGRAPLTLCKGQRVAMTSTAVISISTVSPAEMAALEADFAMGGAAHPAEANRGGILQAHVRTAGELMTALDGTGGDGRPIGVEPIPVESIASDPRQPDFISALPGGGGGGGGPKVPGPNIIVNPGFETGTFAGWTPFDEPGSTLGSGFTVYTGAAVLPQSGTAVLAPPLPGAFAAITDQSGAGSHVLYQDVVIPVNGVLSFDLYINNQAGAFSLPVPASLSFDPDPLVPGLEPNQQARVDLVNQAAPILDVGGGVVRNLFQTNVGDPNVSGYNTFVFDVSALGGQNLRLRFAEVDNVFLFQFGVDNVSLVDPAFPGDLIFQGSGSFRAIAEPLVRLGVPLEVGTDPAFAADLLDIRDGGRIVMISAAPVVLLEGGPVIVGTADTTGFDSPNRLFNIRGANIDPATGLGTDQPIIGNGVDPPAFPGAARPVGSLLEATNGTTIAVLKGAGDTAGGNALYLDTALLEASLPILRLIGSATAQTTVTTDGSTIDLFKSAVTALGPVV
ncbi:MAG: FecR family protein, partial [candidate division NC10 bacterium]|nr:FecR family protein [candidate division NC10 bacterium]